MGAYPGSFHPPIPPPPPPPKPRRGRGVTENGIPLGHRGGLTLDTAAFGDAEGDAAGGTISVAGSYPMSKRFFFDTRLPLGISAPRGADVALFAVGNPNVGVHGDIRANKAFWITLGGGLGLPVANQRSQNEVALELPPVPHGAWNMHDFYPNAVPLSFETLFEGHISSLILRLEIDPVFYIPYEPNDEPEFVIQHAGELQIGHAIGGGLRIQGVAVPTGDNFEFSYFDGDFYQLAFEPFFAIEDELLFARVGVLLPMDEQLGPPFEQSWGFRFKTGVHID